MAGEWISIDCNIEQKPKFARVVMATGEPAEIVLARIVRFWLWVQLTAVDGVADGNPDVLAHIHGGNPEFWVAVAAAGWLEFDPNGEKIHIPDWDERFSMAAKQRKQSARRMAKMRGNANANVTQQRNGVTQRRNNVTQQRNRCVTRQEEKREEEKRGKNLETPNGVSCPDGFAPVPAATDPADDFNEFLAPRPDGATPETVDAPTGPPRAATRPKRAKRVYRIGWNENGGFTGITDADRDLWKTAYPAVDIDRALAAAHAWLIANPAKARKSNWGAFITGWLQREQNRGGDVKSNPINRAVSHEDRRNAQSMADRAARAKTNYSWRDDARRMMTEDEYRIWRAGYERERQRQRETGDDGNEFLKIRRPDAS